MSTPSNINLAILKRVAKWHQERGVDLSTVPNHSALAELFGTTTTTYTYTDDSLTGQAIVTLNKKIESLTQGRSSAGAAKLLRLKQRAERLGLESEELTSLIKKEAVRLIDRALILSARHGAKARVRIATLSALTEAGFIESDDLNLVKTAMMTSDMVKDLVTKTNEEEALRFKVYVAAMRAPSPTPGTMLNSLRQLKRRVAKKRKPTVCNRERRTNGTMPCKPLTKTAFLLSANGSKKQAIKDERTTKAKARRLKSKANGGAKVGGPGDCVQVRNPNFGLCAAGHVGTKVVA